MTPRASARCYQCSEWRPAMVKLEQVQNVSEGLGSAHWDRSAHFGPMIFRPGLAWIWLGKVDIKCIHDFFFSRIMYVKRTLHSNEAM